MEPEVEVVSAEPNEPVAAAEAKHNAFIRTMIWIFAGPQGLRAGWSIFLFVVFELMIVATLGTIYSILHLMGKEQSFSANNLIVQMAMFVPAVAGAAWLVAKINRHRFDAYYLSGEGRARRFVVGLVAGFAAVSLMIGTLYFCGLVRFGAVALAGSAIWIFAAMWGVGFLLVGLNEEGTFRCFLQYVLSRSMNFVTAIGTFASFVALAGSILFLSTLIKEKRISAGPEKVMQWLTGSPMLGVYLMFVLGLLVCVWFYRRGSDAMRFWLASWIGSSLFGLVHTFNPGENWIGIFSAAAIGFVFCVSVKLTGSVWWAIGFHAAWDWGLTYFYGAADSGNPAQGHFLSTSPVGNALWSGGDAGPEGSLLILPLMVVVVVGLNLAYGRKKAVVVEIEAR